MSYYVWRSSTQNPAGVSYIGPIRSLKAAQAEAAAWRSTGERAEVLHVTTETRRRVRDWKRVTRADDAREIVTYRGEEMTRAAYRLHYELSYP